MSIAILKTMYAQKTWANAELYDCMATVIANQHAELLHSAVRMLNHIYVVDCIFRAHLLGEPHGYTQANTVDTPALSELHFAAAETDLWFESYVAGLDSSALAECLNFQFTDGDAGRMTREEILFHVITHGAYHRGNVGQMLKGISIAPPRDLLTKFLHQREPARRLAVLQAP